MLSLLGFFVIGCQSEAEKQRRDFESRIHNYLTLTFIENNKSVSIDSILIRSIDTLTNDTASNPVDLRKPVGYGVYFDVKAHDSKNAVNDLYSRYMVFDLDKRILHYTRY